jgi:dienelactone hydrolase
MRRALLIAALGATLAMLVPGAARAQVRYLDPVFTQIQSTKDIVYGNSVNYLGQAQDLKLDLYEPVGDEETKRAVFIWAHGGYFTQGDKSNIGVISDHMTQRGWVTISVNYRLNPTLPEGAGYIPAGDLNAALGGFKAIHDAQYDVQAAVRWVRAHAEQFRLDPDRVALGGHSAGATTSMTVAYNSDDPGNSGNPGYSSHVTAAIGTGTANAPFLDVHPDPGVEPPTAMYHGDQDSIPFLLPQSLCLIAQAMLNVCEFHLYAGEGHHSRVGLNDWLAFLYPYVIGGAQAPVRIPSGTLPTLPGVPVPPPGSIPIDPIPLPLPPEIVDLLPL